MLSQPMQEGELETFIKSFNNFEKDYDLFRYCTDSSEFPWWDLVRYDTQLLIATQKQLLGSREIQKISIFANIFKLTFKTLRLIYWFIVLHLSHKKLGSITSIYISSRSLPYVKSAINFDDEKIMCIGSKQAFIGLEVDLTFPKVVINDLIDISSSFIDLSNDIEEQIHTVEKHLSAKFFNVKNLKPLLKNKYKKGKFSYWLWAYILRMLPSLKKIYLLQDDTLQPLILKARHIGIKTIEIQHGYSGKSNFAYSYPKLSYSIDTLPETFLVNRDTGDLVYPAEYVFLPKIINNEYNGARDLHVLIASSPRRTNELKQILDSLIDIRWLKVGIKLHPVEGENLSLNIKSYPFRICIFKPHDNFSSVASRSKIFIPINPNSTTVFEASEAGSMVLNVNTNKTKLTSMCDDLFIATVTNLDEMPSVIISLINNT